MYEDQTGSISCHLEVFSVRRDVVVAVEMKEEVQV